MEASTGFYLAMGIAGLVAIYWWERRTARKARRRHEAMRRCLAKHRKEVES